MGLRLFQVVVLCLSIATAVRAAASDSSSPASKLAARLANDGEGGIAMPYISGYEHPFAAVFQQGLHRNNEWRWERWPVSVAIWPDGVVVWSTSEYRYRAPYVIGRVSPAIIEDLMRWIRDHRVYESPYISTETVCSPNAPPASVVSVKSDDGSAMLLKLSPDMPGGNPAGAEEAFWNDVAARIRAVTEGAEHVTTAALVFSCQRLSGRDVKTTQDLSGRLPGYVRGVWMISEQMKTAPDQIEGLLQRISGGGFNTVFVPTQYRGTVVYPGSRYLWQAETEEWNSNVLDWLIPSVHDKGMRAEAWAEYGFCATFDAETSRGGKWLLKHPELAALDSAGRDYIPVPGRGYYRFLCPANPKSHDLLIDLYSEMLERYPGFDGLNLDRIRFPDSSFCYCEFCRKRFLEDTGTTLTGFAENSREWQQWMKWRQERLTEFIRRLSEVVRGRFPRRTLSVCVDRPDQMVTRGQAWPLWIRKGYVDSVIPLLFAGGTTESGFDQVKQVLSESDRKRVVVGILASKDAETEATTAKCDGYRGHAVWHAKSVSEFLQCNGVLKDGKLRPATMLFDYGKMAR